MMFRLKNKTLLKTFVKKLKQEKMLKVFFFTEENNPLIKSTFRRCRFKKVSEAELPTEMQKERMVLEKEGHKPIPMGITNLQKVDL